uniref:C2H2-type domain-containing protein n=1 Tax=Steinernema glaseri TaxID=37863 RepID=A0A1I7YDC5_9BILA
MASDSTEKENNEGRNRVKQEEFIVEGNSAEQFVQNPPFICQQCHKAFPKPWRLRSHIAHVHLLHRPYLCVYCTAGFRSPYDLRRHMTVHTGERFKCDTCGASFGSKQRVAHHLIKGENCWPRHGKPPAAIRSTMSSTSSSDFSSS